MTRFARSPEQLKKRIEDKDLEAMKAAEEEKLSKIKIDEETVGVTEHKGSKWESNWKNFKEQNPLVQSKLIFPKFKTVNIDCCTCSWCIVISCTILLFKF